jgi:hypothetical protein
MCGSGAVDLRPGRCEERALAYDRTLVQIRERSFLDVLDLAMVVVREYPLTLGLTALAGVLPFAALNAWLLSDVDFPPQVVFYLWMLEVPWATAPLTVVLGGLMFSDRPSVWRVVKTLARSLFSMVVFQFFLRGILVVFPIFYVFVPTRLAFLDEVILLERGRWWKASRRSSEICAYRRADLFAQWLAQLFFGLIFVLAFWAGAGALAQTLIESEATWEPIWADLIGVRTQFAFWVATAFFGVARFFTYIDHRIRLEGWEVRILLLNAGRSMEESRRW